MALNPCALTNFLANNYYEAVKLINRKFNALRRLAELLEQIGDLSGFIPDIGALVPLYLVNLDAYTNLVSACPFLNLPKNPSTEDIVRLQAQVAAAYTRLTDQLLKHPWVRMGKLQAQLDKVQGRVNDILAQGEQYFQCLQQACRSAEQAVNFVAEIADTDFKKEFDDYTRNVVGSNTQVLNSAMRNKRNEVQGAIDNINELASARPFTDTPGGGGTVPDLGRAPQIPQLPPNPPG
jgi:hypothetical protein